MKYIIRESQIDKQVLFHYWDTIGKENIFLEDYDLSLKMLNMERYGYLIFIEWWGGVEELLKYFKTLQGKKFKVGRNGYDFDVVLTNFGYDVSEYMFECEANTTYKGDIMMNGEIYNLEDVIETDYLMDEEDILNEIRWEIRDIINEFIDDKIPGGFLLRCIDVNFI